jgi:hypothetical protein
VLDRGGWLKPRLGLYTPPARDVVLVVRRLCEPQGQYGRVREISSPPAFDPRAIQFVASCYTDWAIPTQTTVVEFINSWIPAVFPPCKFSLPIWSNETLISNLKTNTSSGKLLDSSSEYLEKHTADRDTKCGVQRRKCPHSENTASNKHLILRRFSQQQQRDINRFPRNAYKQSSQKNWTAFSRTCFPPRQAAFFISHTDVE